VFAHRGGHHEGPPENTFAAFERAVELGADAIELDVRRSADGELVIFHDAKLGRDPVAKLTAPELSERAGYEVPTLAAVLAWARGRIRLDVELKEDGYVELVAAPLSRFHAAGGELLVTSFLDPVLVRLAGLAPAVPRGLLIGMTAIGAVRRARSCAAAAIVVQARLASDRLLHEAYAAGLQCIVWDALETAGDHARFLHDPRIDGVITDHVAWALAERVAGR
jgi:glycerophosphoryl diester phosphodiesterase